ncbi:MAG: ATP-grasp domain-containing protein [Saprospirales bacterium]|nr:ATP-grasp domain-containing protein [Saprospirales bacterium]MBK8493059.1 ATP-grasp domain-containing protein [Saprospirales bacterium]
MIQHSLVINRAKKHGISVTDIGQLMQANAAILEHNGISELLIDGVPTSWINVRSQFYCDNKQLTKLAYEALHIPHPRSVTFKTPADPSLNAFFKEGKQYVCKPLDNTNGLGVVMHIRSLEMVEAYFEEFNYLNTQYLLEEQVEGKDLRIQVIRGKIVAACIREPAFVVGNGHDSLETLIEQRRAIMRTQNPDNSLEIDSASKALLAQQGISLSDIPPKDQKVSLKYVSNMAQGGMATDVTDEIHPLYREWATALSSYLNTGYMGLDFITTDPQQNPLAHAWILEINARAEWLHHTFSERKQHDMAGIILKEVFGERRGDLSQ